MKWLIVGLFLLMSSGAFADDVGLYFEGDDNFSVAPAKIKQIVRITESQDLESGRDATFCNDKHEFDEKGRRTSRSPGFIYWDPGMDAGYGRGPHYKNFYDEQGRIKERWQSWYEDFSTVTKTFYDYSGVNTVVTERYYGPTGDTEELQYVEWTYRWQDERLLSKNVFSPRGEIRSDYRYYECFGVPWDGKLKKIVATQSDYDKFFRTVNSKTSERLMNYDVKGWLKEEIFIGASGQIDFINTYDERGDVVEIRAYYSSGILASREEFKHSYEKINGLPASGGAKGDQGIELRTKTVNVLYHVEWRDKGDGSYLCTEVARQRKTVTYKYEFYK